MELRIYHETRYGFSSDVFFEPHVLRFKPKTTPHIELKAYDIEISPEPAGKSDIYDVENNHSLTCWFEGIHRELTIKSESIVKTKSFNPFNFLIYPIEYKSLPFQYQPLDLKLLSPAIHSVANLSGLAKYMEEIKRDSGHDTLRFLSNLTQKIHSDFTVESRETGHPLEPAQTFDLRSGSCRDLSWMLIHILRQSGIASRFVSGYFYFHSDSPDYELHAWMEAYIPGAGWIGLDPSHGLITGHSHIPIASSAFYENTMPVTGSSRGKASGNLYTNLNIGEIKSRSDTTNGRK